MVCRALLIGCALLCVAAPASAQHEHHAAAPQEGWAWSFDSTAFLTANLQERRFRDFHHIESQNWFMASAARRVARGRLNLHGMFSLEPFTLRDLGSAQAFQTGETFGGAPLIDYQHPHDLLMGLSASFELPLDRWRLQIGGGLVDAPALGPQAFMHRPTATLHPTAPLAHHQLDATHITHGVASIGLAAGSWQIETSAFRGREPDEDRLDLELGAFDSAAVRGSWARGGTRAQASIGWLNAPDALEPGDVTRLTASVEQRGTLLGGKGALMAAWGQNREALGTESAWLFEAAQPTSTAGTAYTRVEIVDKHILEAGGLHPPEFQHPHTISTVTALTLGYQHRFPRLLDWAPGQAAALGIDVTGHLVPTELVEAYGRPVSVHVYARWTFAARSLP